MHTKKVLVIGAGFGGLSAAALLARDGFKVTVLEKNEQTGGRARVWRKDGFVFDMGPSWYLMPDVFEKYFALFNKKTQDYYKLVRLDPNYRAFFGTKKTVDVPAQRKEIDKLFDELTPNGSAKLKEYLYVAQYQYEIAMQEFMYRDYKTIFDFFNWKVITKGIRLKIFENFDKFARRYFEDTDIRKILEYTVVFLGGSPNNTPGLYSIMSHVDFDLGVWYPCGGIGQLVRAFTKLAEEQGVNILLNQDVKKIDVVQGRANKIMTDKGEFEADIILVNADYQFAETQLLEGEFRTYDQSYWEKKKMGPSAFLIYLGLNKRISGLLHHNLYLDPSWDEHFRSIFDDPVWPGSPSYYVSCPSKTDKTVAPEGCENLFVLVPVAPGLEDNESIRERYFRKTITHLEKLIGESICDHIVVKRTFAHNDFKEAYNAYKGTALGMSHTLLQTAVFRPAHHSKKVENLYYTGSYNHPGIGVPMVIISSQIVSKTISDRHGR
ncbi:phytoene dehydrogenase [candidate division WOR_3 bacterium SM23_60]|uniref:Phytoene dehydrogenase n=1 Tax=candidate division WOR_3 bacterium SM23_60 TaxID=1703780 RepID=A0A0S8GJF5_UNCW3|nr:MAG: phytoene dehydrogenase [candidate division WOR_3 bacterium SM23_60]